MLVSISREIRVPEMPVPEPVPVRFAVWAHRDVTRLGCSPCVSCQEPETQRCPWRRNICVSS